MSRRSRFSAEEKHKIILEVIEEHQSANHVAKKYLVCHTTIADWIRKYKENGLEGLKESVTWKRYSDYEKQVAVLSVITGEKSILQATKTFQISSTSVLRGWILSYTNGEILKSTAKGRVPQMTTKGRKTTYQERIEITQFTIANDLNYQQAMETYQVSYQQVYSWVKKYQSQGESALKDNRGRSKSAEFLTDEERLKLRIKELETRNRHLEMENDFAKKLQEIQRRNQP